MVYLGADVPAAEWERAAASHRARAAVVGVTGSDRITLPGGETVAVADLRRAHEEWLPTYMASQPAAVAA